MGPLCCKKKAEIKWALRRKWPCHVMMVMTLNYYKSNLMDLSLSNTEHVEYNKQSLHLQPLYYQDIQWILITLTYKVYLLCFFFLKDKVFCNWQFSCLRGKLFKIYCNYLLKKCFLSLNNGSITKFYLY